MDIIIFTNFRFILRKFLSTDTNKYYANNYDSRYTFRSPEFYLWVQLMFSAHGPHILIKRTYAKFSQISHNLDLKF